MWGSHSQPNSNWNWSVDGTPDQQQPPFNNQVYQNNIGHDVHPQQQPTYHDGLQPTSWNWSAESNVVPPDQQTWSDYTYQNTADPQMCLQQQPPYYDEQYMWQPSAHPTDQTQWQYSGNVWDNQLANSGENFTANSSIPHDVEQSVHGDNRLNCLQASQPNPRPSNLQDNNVAAHRPTSAPRLVDGENNGSIEGGNSEMVMPTTVVQKSDDRPNVKKVAVDDSNQEVPEPNVDHPHPYFQLPGGQEDSLKVESTQGAEELPNQQNPNESSIHNAGLIEESRNVVIKPREGSLFQPPLHQSSGLNKKPVVQREAEIEATPLYNSEPESVNLETEPDNLERPPDVDSSRRQHIHMNLHRPHHVTKLDSTTLWESPDIPSVTFIPSLVGPALDLTPANLNEPDANEGTDTKERVCDRAQFEEKEEKSGEKVKQMKSHVEHKIPEVGMYQMESHSKSRMPETSPSPYPQSSSRMPETSPSPYPQGKHAPSENISNTSTEYEDKLRSRTNASPRSHNDRTYDSEETQNHHQRPRDGDKHRNYDYDERRPRDDYHSSNNSRPSSRLSDASNYDRYYNDGESRRHYHSGRERTPSQLHETDHYHHADRRRNEEYASSKSQYDRYYNDNDGRRYHYPERERTPSRLSESEHYTHADHRQSEEYSNNKRYGDRSSRYNREHDYYQRSKYKGYGYGDYREEYYNYYDPYSRRYASNYNSYDYGFYDELYRTDPRYRQQVDQYRSYYENYGEPDLDRLSLHSSHSSTADELRKDTMLESYGKEYDRSSTYSLGSQNTQPFGDAYHEGYGGSSRLDSGLALEATQPRLTPYKFTCSHVVARLSAGRLIKVVPNSSSTSMLATVEIHDLQAIFDAEDIQQELKPFPGPLIRGETHKNDVMHFCHQKIKELRETKQISDRDGHILLWELLVMLLRQNGSVVGSDIAELLLKGHEILQQPKIAKSTTSDTMTIDAASEQGETNDIQSPDEGIVVSQETSLIGSATSLSMEHAVLKFREYLLFGHKKDALEWAIKNALWGHALFLASKMDPRTYANIMIRFANSLALNDPLQSLYQLMSGRQPAAVTCVVDESWGDWRPHLAMILSNPSSHPEVDQRSITTLGDTLAQTGYLCAAHFCYLMAQVDFGSYEVKISKLVLLGSSQLHSFAEFSCCEAIQCTEIYEYAQSLANPNFVLLHLLPYKFIYATRLAEYGFLQDALHYCEILSETVIQMATEVSYTLTSQICELARKLKYYDPSFSHGQGELEEQSDPIWLQNMLQLLESLKMNTLPSETGIGTYNAENLTDGSNAPAMQPYGTDHADTSTQHYEQYSGDQSYTYVQQDYQPNNSWSNTSYQSPMSQMNASEGSVYGEQSFSAEHSLYQPTHVESAEENPAPSGANLSPSYKTSTGFDYYGFSTQQTISRERQDSVNSLGRRSSGASTVSNAIPPIPANKHEKSEEPRKLEKKEVKKPQQTGRSWLGGIFGKLLPKGPNQMILPDDKNPAIIWDSVSNKWVNKGSEESSAEAPPVAPPTDLELNKNLQQPDVPLSPPPPLGVNKFQRPKTKGMRQNYVDVLNTSNKVKINPMEDKIPFNSETTPTPVSNYLIPSPGPENNGLATDFISSPASLVPPISQVAENYQVTNPEDVLPTMFDPAEFSTSHNINDGKVKTSRLGRRSYQR